MGLLNVKTLKKYSPLELSITLDDAKAQCLIVPEDTTQDVLLKNLILAAQSIIEGDATIPYCFFKSQFEAIFIQDKARILLPKSPVASVEKVEEFNDGAWVELPMDKCVVELGDNLSFVITDRYSREFSKKLKITFTAGNETAGDVPLNLKQAVAALVAYLYEYRGFSTNQTLKENTVYKAIVGGLRRTSF